MVRILSLVILLRLIGVACATGVTFFIGYNFSPEVLGLYGFTISIIGLLSTVVKFGIDKYLIKTIAVSDTKYVLNLIWGSMTFSILVSVLIAIIASSGLFYFKPDLDLLVKLCPLAIPLPIISFQVYSVLYALKEQALATTLQFVVTQFILILLLAGLNTYLSRSPIELYFIALFSTAVYSLAIYIKKIGYIGRLNKRTLLRGIIIYKNGFNYFLISASTILWGYIDILMIGSILGMKVLGVYIIGQRIANVSSIILTSFNNYCEPRFADHVNNSKLSQIKLLFKRVTYIQVALVIMYLILVLLSWTIIERFFPEYYDSLPIVIILLLGQLCNAAFGPLASLLQMTNQAKIYRKYTNLITLALIALNYLFINLLGIFGAAISTVLLTVIINVVANNVLNNRFYLKN